MKIKYVTGIVLAIGLMGCQRNTENFDATGTFEATEVIVSAEASGKLIHFRADEGVQLTCGEEVGLIDTVQLHLQKMQLLANRKSVDTQRPDIGKQIAATRQQIAKAEQEKSRVERLLQSNAANRKQWDDWNAEIALLNKQLEAQHQWPSKWRKWKINCRRAGLFRLSAGRSLPSMPKRANWLRSASHYLRLPM